MPLATPRAVLTALLNRITSIPLLDDGTTDEANNQQQNQKQKYHHRNESKSLLAAKNNPLRRVPISHRHLIITLHVLFPEILLPALDLLDRGLITRLVLLDHSPSASYYEEGGLGKKEEADQEERAKDDEAVKSEEKEKEKKGGKGTGLYLATSAIPPSSRRKKPEKDDEAGGRRRYIVHLQAWNCTCAAFAFSFALDQDQDQGHAGFSSDQQDTITLDSIGIADGGIQEGNDTGVISLRGDEEEEEWSLGGMSLDGILAEGEGAVPICKHLMACLLADRWTAALGRYVIEKKVESEEMAGIVADI